MNLRILSGTLTLLTLAVYPASGQTYAITASNVVMSTTGTATSRYTVASVPLTGTLTISCTNAGTMETSMRVPICYTGPPHAVQVVAGQTVTGAVSFYPYPVPQPAIAIIGAGLLVGLMMRRRRWLTAVVLAAALAGSTALSGCGGSSSGLAPGTYQFTVTAVNAPAGTGSPSLVTTVVSVKVQ